MQRVKQTARSWIWVIFVALILSLFVWYQKTQNAVASLEMSYPGRTYTILSDLPKRQFGEATDSTTPSIYDADLSPPQSTWIEYRSRQTTDHLATTVEPQASVSLMAPTPDVSQDEWLSNMRRQSQLRRPSQLANDSHYLTASAHISDSKNQGYSDLAKSDLRSNQPTGIWPVPEKLLSELTKLEQTATNGFNSQFVSIDDQASDGLDKSHETSVASAQRLSALSKQAHELVTKLTSLSDCCVEAQTIFGELETIADSLLQLASASSHDIQVAEMASRTAYSIKRRTKLWQGVHLCLTTDAQYTNSANEFSRDELSKRISEVLSHSQQTGDAPGWYKYLLIADFERIASSNNLEDFDIYAARQLLDRVSWSGVTQPQRDFLSSKPVKSLAEYVQPIAIKPIDYRSLLAAFETLENDALHRCSLSVVSSLQSLRYSNNPNQVALAGIIGTYYRNANIRVAVSADLINRFIPKTNPVNRPVKQTILGARTTGGSIIDNTLSIALTPNPSAWHVQLQLNADIASKTASEKWPAVVHSASQMNVVSSREIVVSPEMLKVQPGSKESITSNDRVRDVETDFDALPIVSDFVRYFVDQQIRDQRPVARRITQNLVRTETNREFDSQLSQQLETAQQKVQDRVIKPFQFIGIDTDVVDLQTTDSRLIARYRIASLDTLAANTPRPQAPSDSLLSMQIHQSAINNTFNQLRLGSKEWHVGELMSYLSERMNLGIIENREELPENVLIQFEDLNPICIEFVDNQILVSLRIAKLKEPGRIDLSHFVIRVTYGLEAEGLSATLVRTGAISVDGERLGMRDRLPLRAIFGKIFAAHSRVPLIKGNIADDPRLEGLAVSQIVSREGWIALAISPRESPHVAVVQPELLTR